MRPHYLPGDLVARRKGLVMHHGIALGGGRVLHNTPFRGEHISSEEEFLAGQRLHVTRLPYDARVRALRHADDWTGGRGYNLLTNNCEHTVTRAMSGAARSPQLIGWAAGVAVGAAAFALTRHAGAAAAGYTLAKRLAEGSFRAFR